MHYLEKYANNLELMRNIAFVIGLEMAWNIM